MQNAVLHPTSAIRRLRICSWGLRSALRGERIAEEFQALVADYVERRFGALRKSA
ncbi:MAG: hypothetical protein ACREJ5_27085 [Geminicoccaceae bacterium]